jgi:hypothetical protein
VLAALLVAAFLPTLASAGFRSLGADDWPLLALAGAGALLAARRPRSRATLLRLATLAAPLALIYAWKNPDSARYAAQLVPALALAAALGVGLLARPRLPLVAAAGAAAVAVALVSPLAKPGPDAFRALAPGLAESPAGPLVTAAPDAYGVLLPQRTILVMRPGASGLVLIDAAARAYEPDLRIAGKLVATIPAPVEFRRPDGRLDAAPALLYRGRVVSRAGSP